MIVDITALMRKLNYIDQTPYEYAKGEKLYPAEIHSIEIIGQYSELNLTELAAKIGVTKGAVSRMAKKLEQKRLITKKQLPGNKKDMYLCLTEKGKDVFTYHLNCHKEIDLIMLEQFASMSDQERLGVKKFVDMSSSLLDTFLENMK